MSLNNHSYDPSEVDERPRSSYFTKKDIRTLAIVGVFAIILLYPVYKVMLGNSEKAQCAQTLKDIQSAMLIYMQQHDDNFPPLYMEGPNGEPLLLEGKPFTWASSIAEGMSKRSKFSCPTANKEENVVAQNPVQDGKDIVMSYGMYSPWSAYPSSMVTSTKDAILIAETSNFGSNNTYDPYPYKDANGNIVKVDGFSIGWDVGNRKEDWQKPGVLAEDMPKWVTRLAFPNTKDGKFGPKSQSRHVKGIHVLYADGHIKMLEPTKVRPSYDDVGGDLKGIWRTR